MRDVSMTGQTGTPVTLPASHPCLRPVRLPLAEPLAANPARGSARPAVVFDSMQSLAEEGVGSGPLRSSLSLLLIGS